MIACRPSEQLPGARSTWLPSLPVPSPQSYAAAGKKATARDKFMRAIDDNPRFVAVPPTGRGVTIVGAPKERQDAG